MMGGMDKPDLDQLSAEWARAMMGEPTVRFIKLDLDAKVPKQAKPNDAGYDLFAISSHDLKPGQRVVVKTGLAMAIPPGFYGRIAPRSGLAVKNGIDVLAGVVDAGYRDEVGVVLINLSDDPNAIFPIRPGMRVAQIIIEKRYDAHWTEVEELPSTERGLGGYGHTGA